MALGSGTCAVGCLGLGFGIGIAVGCLGLGLGFGIDRMPTALATEPRGTTTHESSASEAEDAAAGAADAATAGAADEDDAATAGAADEDDAAFDGPRAMLPRGDKVLALLLGGSGGVRGAAPRDAAPCDAAPRNTG